jgi:tripartite-type tricarboxylate transporter receptor subunit TctC
MKIWVRTTLVFAVLLSTLHSLPAAAQANWDPRRPVRIIIGFGAGGTTDVIGRAVAKVIENQRGWTVLTENKGGAGGTIAAAEIRNIRPDGMTIGLFSTSVFGLDPYISERPRYMPEDFDYLGTIGSIEYALVAGRASPITDIASLVATARSRGFVTLSATGRLQELVAGRLARQFGIEIVSVQTRGSAESLQLVLGGHADVTISGGVHVPAVLSGDIRSIGAITDARHGYAPDVRTLREQGVDISLRNYFMYAGPRNLPPEVRATWEAAIDQAVASPEVAQAAQQAYSTRGNLGGAASAEEIRTQSVLWRRWIAEGEQPATR